MARVDGIELCKAEIKRQAALRAQAVMDGMELAGKHLLRASRKLVPVDYGILKASGFVRSTHRNRKFAVTVGYSAEYAVYVHENLDALHGAAFNRAYAKELAAKPKTGPFRHSRGPNQQAKFLEVPAKREAKVMAQIIREAATS